MLAGTFFSAISQVLLKQSANITYKNPLREYLNWRVILAYGIFFGVLLLNTWCYTRVDMKFGPVIDTAAYVFVLIFSWRILKEKITRGKIIGNLIIILGILIYTLYLQQKNGNCLLYPKTLMLFSTAGNCRFLFIYVYLLQPLLCIHRLHQKYNSFH